MDTQNNVILAVDDSRDVLQVIEKSLTEIGYHIETAYDVQSAEEKIKNLNPALILLDVMLPDGNGFELCRELKKSKDTQDIPVIFLTALTFTGDKMQAFSVGAADYLAKPVFRVELQSRVSLHMKSIHQTKRIAELEAEVERLRAQQK